VGRGRLLKGKIPIMASTKDIAVKKNKNWDKNRNQIELFEGEFTIQENIRPLKQGKRSNGRGRTPSGLVEKVTQKKKMQHPKKRKRGNKFRVRPWGQTPNIS